MRLNLTDKTVVFDRETVRQLLEIEECKGAWKAFGNLPPDRLTELWRIATIESVGASTRIEGAKLSDKEVARILVNLSTQSFSTRDEQEAAGCALLMNEIFDSREEAPLTENLIKRMHGTLLRFCGEDERHRGEYKTVDNHLAAFDQSGQAVGVLFETASASETPALMEALVEWTNRQFLERNLPPVIVIGMFTAAFLAIHPFQDGNGRLSRAFTTLLMLRAGYGYVPYSSLESVMEASKANYYLALHATQKTLRTEAPNWNVWLAYFLRSLVRQVRNLKRKMENERLLRNMPETSMRILDLIRREGPVSIAEAAASLKVNKFTLRDHFKRLVREGRLIPLGRGRATKYALTLP